MRFRSASPTRRESLKSVVKSIDPRRRVGQNEVHMSSGEGVDGYLAYLHMTLNVSVISASSYVMLLNAPDLVCV